MRRRDGAAGVELLRTRPLGPVLQYAGDLLIAALAQQVEGARPGARKCLEELAGRDRPGDAELARELARELSAVRGRRQDGDDLTEVPVDLGELGIELDGDFEGDARVVDLVEGEVLLVDALNGADTGVPEPAFDEASEAYDRDRWLVFWPLGGREPGDPADMADFATTVEDEGLQGRLLKALGERWAQRRFLEVIKETPEDHRWLLFQEERQRGRARAWLAGHGYRPGQG